MNRVFGQARQRVGQRVFLRLLEDNRVVDDGRGLLGDRVEAAGDGRRYRRTRSVWYTAIVPMNRSLNDKRTDERRLQRRVAPMARGFEVGARLRVHQRPAVARDPAGQDLVHS